MTMVSADDWRQRDVDMEGGTCDLALRALETLATLLHNILS